MLLSGILSIIQITFLPGYILTSYLKMQNRSIIEKLVYIFAFSLFINYFLVTILTLLGIYKLFTIYILLLLESLIIINLFRLRTQINLQLNNIHYFVSRLLSFSNKLSPSRLIIVSIASLIVLFYYSLIIANTGTMFYFVDPVNLIHLNTWAMDFANNMLPQQSSHFPQLIPANWSLTYLLIGEMNVHFFPKFIMPMFFFFNLLIFLDLALRKNNFIYIIALIIYGLFAPIIYSLVFIADGTADLPVSFFAFLTFYKFLLLDKNKFVLNDQLLFFAFASMTAATKLAGFYTFTVASFFSLYMLIRYWQSIKKHEFLIVMLSVVAIISISHFWYLLKPATMAAGLHQPQWVGEDYSLIFINALRLLYFNWGLPVCTFFILTLISSLFIKEIRYVTLIMVIPPIVIWMFKFSDDFRNLSFVVPFLSYTSAFGLKNLIEKSFNRKVKLEFSLPKDEPIRYNTKYIIGGGIVSVLSVLLVILVGSEFFYSKLYEIYKFISIHYYQSHRINLLIDYTPYTSIDYYQKTIGVLLILIPLIYVFGLLKVKTKHIIIAAFIATISLSFSFIKSENILLHQKKLLEIVDARNYGAWVNTIITSAGLDRTIYTNFKTISEENREKLNFVYKNDFELTELLKKHYPNEQFFLNRELLSLENIKMIDELLSENKIDMLFDDGEFVLFNYYSNTNLN